MIKEILIRKCPECGLVKKDAMFDHSQEEHDCPRCVMVRNEIVTMDVTQRQQYRKPKKGGKK